MPSDGVLIIGAGPAGLSAADELLRQGYENTIEIWEADPHYVGGISKTIEWEGYRFDIGGHRFFSKSDLITQRWKSWLGPDLLERERLSRIYYRNRFFKYPLQPVNALINLGPMTAGHCVLSYAKRRFYPIRPEDSFADWVQNRFGRQLFDIFFRSYTEKVWGIPCEDIAADWAAQRIKGLSLSTAVRAALFGTPQGEIKTLIDRFYYPRLGPGMMWNRVAKKVQDEGALLHLDTSAGLLAHREGSVYMVQGGQKLVRPKQVISSMPLKHLLLGLRPLPPKQVIDAANALKYRDFMTVALVLDEPNLFPDNWIYIHDGTVNVGRIQNFGNWSPDLLGDPRTSCVGLEYFVNQSDEIWHASESDLLKMASKELLSLGLTKNAKIIKGTVIRQPRAYPVYDKGYQQNRSIIQDYLKQFTNLQIIGRNGMHRYNNQDHAMMTGILAAQNVMGADWNLELVNSDAEYHEELSTERLTPQPLH
ncbi:MAG: NAD(P)/FAD-dependent oxidoreductase [Myxococcota bacterium]|nr:NAD(P)/FAD-dependent oxidoreductase [Myxococcota bacterium]